MISRKSQLIEFIISLDRKAQSLLQDEKNKIYQKVLTLRPSSASDFDSVGYNQLHWAVLSNQPVVEINRLINEEKIDVNRGTEFADPFSNFNLTPLKIAVEIGSEKLADCLLKNGANQEYEVNRYHPLIGPISGADYSSVDKEICSIPKIALRKKNPTFKLFEKDFIKKYREEHSNDLEGYNSSLPKCVASLFYYSKKEEFDAENELENLLNHETSDDKWLTDLKNLKEKSPAIEQGELGEIYHASLSARM